MRTLILISIVLLSACSFDEHASYEPLTNTLPEGGPKLLVRDEGPVNVDKMIASLDEEDSRVFDQSLSWFGTESDLPLTTLDGKTARDIVSAVNCLKGPDASEKCGFPADSDSDWRPPLQR